MLQPAAYSLACSIAIMFGSRLFRAGVKFTARFAAFSSTVTISSLKSTAFVRRNTSPSGSTPKTVPALPTDITQDQHKPEAKKGSELPTNPELD